jgi:hypothetical protein
VDTGPVTSRRHRASPDLPIAQLLSLGYRATPLVRDQGMQRWWALAQDTAGRWSVVSVPDSLTESELPTYDPARHLDDGWPSRQWPPLGGFADVAELILAIIRRPRTTTIEGQWDRWAVNAYLDSLPEDQRTSVVHHLATLEPTGWATLQELRCYEANRRVKGRQAEAVVLLKETAARLWPRTMTPGRLTQFGKRCGDEVFMVLPYESWQGSAEDAVVRAADDPDTTTGDTVRGLVTARPFSLSLLD